MTSWHRILGVAAVVGIAAVAAGTWSASRARTVSSAESASVMAALRLQSKAIEHLSGQLDALDCSRRALVATTAPELSAEQLDRVSAAVAARLGQAKGPSPSPLPTPDNVAAFEAGQQLIAAAVRTGHWTEQNAKEFRSLSMQATSEQRRELQAQISVAINDGKIHPDFRGHWF